MHLLLTLILLFAPPKPETPCKKWPYAAWDGAIIYGYNIQPARSGMDWRIFSKEGKLNNTVRFEDELSVEEAKEMAAHVKKIKGTNILSKCFFPRHSVVFYGGDSGEEPVGWLEICFTCQDVRAYPEFKSKKENNPYVEVTPEDEYSPAYDLNPELKEAWKYFEKTFRSHQIPVFLSDKELLDFVGEIR